MCPEEWGTAWLSWRFATMAPSRAKQPRRERKLDRRDWLLLFLMEPTIKKAAPTAWPMDPVRIHKGMFLLSQEGPGPLRGLYDFTPYYYGPCSFDLYGDLDALEESGLLETRPVPGYTWRRYGVTSKGQAKAQELAAHIEPEVMRQIEKVRSFVVSLPFRQLLREIYSRYPAYAQNTLMGQAVAR